MALTANLLQQTVAHLLRHNVTITITHSSTCIKKHCCDKNNEI